MRATTNIGLVGGGFGPGTGPATYDRSVREGLGPSRLRSVDGPGDGLDLVHVLDAKRADLQFLAGLRAPLALDFHDDYWTAPPDYPAPDRLLRRIRQRQLRAHHLKALRHAAVAIVHSRAVAGSLEREIRALKMPRPPRVCLVPLALPTATDTDGTRDRDDRDADRPLILMVGRDLFRKGFGVLLQALPGVREKFPGARALVVGREYLHTRLAARLMARGQVEFLPAQDPSALGALYRRAAVFVLPSWLEAFGLTLLEAMAAGTPVVASRVGGIPEAVEDGVSGLLHQPGDPAGLTGQIIDVLADPALRATLIAGGREQARRFSVPAMVAALEEAYQAAVEAKK